jgi:hypothetical protein
MPIILGDRDRLVRLLSNFAGNALLHLSDAADVGFAARLAGWSYTCLNALPGGAL